MSELIELKVLSNDALPIDENDWGSGRSMEATNKFWEAFKAWVGEESYNEIQAEIKAENLDYDEGIWLALDKIGPYLEVDVVKIMRDRTISEQPEAHKKVIRDLAFGREFMASKDKGAKVKYEDSAEQEANELERLFNKRIRK